MLAAVIAGLMTLPLVAALSFAVVIVLAGPHSGLLPEWIEVLVLALGWMATLAVPVWVGRRVWVRFSRIE